jgi:hypothetical protein
MPTYKNQSGDFFLRLLISLGVTVMIGSAIILLVVLSNTLTSTMKTRTIARFLGEERMEQLRNIAYENLGTVGGVPSGLIPKTETVVREGLPFIVRTSIVYVDDPADGIEPNDTIPTDYKRMRIEVTWEGISGSSISPVVYISDATPPVYATQASTGTLIITVFDANGVPVSNADISINAPTLSPPVSLDVSSDIQGTYTVPGVLACSGCYKITVTKNGYTEDRTYGIDEVANPQKPHQSIITGKVTNISFSIDKVSSLTIETHGSKNNGFPILPNQQIHIHGSKTKGTTSQGNPIYIYDQTITTDGLGQSTLTDLIWDTYELIPSNTSLVISGSVPHLPLSFAPNESIYSIVSLETLQNHAALIQFQNNTNTPISTISASLTNALGASQIIMSGDPGNPDEGQSFYNKLVDGTYRLSTISPLWQDVSSIITISGSNIRELLRLTPK